MDQRTVCVCRKVKIVCFPCTSLLQEGLYTKGKRSHQRQRQQETLRSEWKLDENEIVDLRERFVRVFLDERRKVGWLDGCWCWCSCWLKFLEMSLQSLVHISVRAQGYLTNHYNQQHEHHCCPFLFSCWFFLLGKKDDDNYIIVKACWCKLFGHNMWCRHESRRDGTIKAVKRVKVFLLFLIAGTDDALLLDAPSKYYIFCLLLCSFTLGKLELEQSRTLLCSWTKTENKTRQLCSPVVWVNSTVPFLLRMCVHTNCILLNRVHLFLGASWIWFSAYYNMPWRRWHCDQVSEPVIFFLPFLLLS